MKASDWISVNDRLPKLGEDVLVCMEIDDEIDVFQIICKGYLAMYKNPHCPIGVWNIDNEGIYTDSITHWQKIVLPKKRKEMKRFLTNTWVLVVMLPLYALVLVLYACNWIAKLLVRPLNGTKIKSYKWFDNLDRRMYDLYDGLWR